MIADDLQDRPVFVHRRPGKVHCHAVDGHFYPGAASTDDTMTVGYASSTDTVRDVDLEMYGVQVMRQPSPAMTAFSVHATQHLLERRLQRFPRRYARRTATEAADRCIPLSAIAR